MDSLTSLAISSSALHAQRLRMDVIAANLANAQSTRTPEGGPYKRHDVVLEALDWAVDPNGDSDFSDHLDVVNMSLGSPYGSFYDADAVASDNAVLAGVIVIASIALGAAVVAGAITKDPAQAALVGTVLGYVFSESKLVLAYYFGSSSGSARTTELLSQAPAIAPE